MVEQSIGKRAAYGARCVVVLVGLAFGAGCGTASVADEEGARADLARSFRDACDARVRAGRGPSFPGSCVVSDVTRTVVDARANVVEYRVEIRVGPGEHDAIGLHGVVREVSPFVPVRARNAIMLVHGDAWPFRAAFLDTGDGESFAAFLARSDVDVWGIDLRWTRVPMDADDLSFMRNWGMDQDVRDLGMALSVARLARVCNGGYDVPLKLLGWSRGGQLAYAYVAREAALPAVQRHVGGLIPVDIYLRVDPATPEGAAAKDGACERLARDQDQYDNETGSDRYAVDDGREIAAIGREALDHPSSDHRQDALVAGAETFSLPGGPPPTPRYHFTGGTFDAEGKPIGLAYTDERRWFAAAAQAAPYEPLLLFIDSERVMCKPRAPAQDPLSAVRVPILYVGAEGGFGSSGLYTASLLGSPDQRALVVSVARDALHDVGHGDIFFAREARSMFWEEILGWLKER